MLSSHLKAYIIVQLHQSTEMNTIYTKTLPCVPSGKKKKNGAQIHWQIHRFFFFLFKEEVFCLRSHSK